MPSSGRKANCLGRKGMQEVCQAGNGKAEGVVLSQSRCVVYVPVRVRGPGVEGEKRNKVLSSSCK